jgi:alanine racemase
LTSWLEISDARLRANYAAFAKAVGAATSVLGVVKANAYGHGVERCAQILAHAKAEWLGVTGVEEGRLVRRALTAAGLTTEMQPRILVMSGISEQDAPAIIQHELTPVVWSVEQVAWLQTTAERLALRTTVPVHLEIDSGMTRQGVRPGSALKHLVAAIQSAKALRLDGVMTHFAAAEVTGSGHSQRRQFERALAETAAAGVLPAWISAGNTSGLDLVEGPEEFPAWLHRLARGIGARAMVRAGLGLYGYHLPLEPAPGARTVISRLEEELQPVMTWKAKVIAIEQVPAGAAIGYNGTYIAAKPMRLALVAAGYADGLRRELSSTNTRPGGWVMLRGKRAPIVGRISMNLTSVDVTAIRGVHVGGDATLLGDGITADDHARIAGTIAYEILCGVRACERAT